MLKSYAQSMETVAVFPPDATLFFADDGRDCSDCELIIILPSSVAEKGAEGCKDLMEAFAACVKSAAEGTS